MIKSGEPITKDDLDDLATAANLRVVPLDMESSPQDTIGTTYTLTGPFAFEDLPGTHKAQWRDELNRIWNSFMGRKDGILQYDYLADEIALRLANYWNLDGSNRRIVASQGPTLMTHAYAGRDLIASNPVGVRAFKNARMYFSKLDAGTFGVGVGPCFGTSDNPLIIDGSGGFTTVPGPADVSFDYNLESAFAFSVEIVWEFTRDGSTNSFPDVVQAFFEAGFGNDSSVNASSIDQSPDGTKVYVTDTYGSYDFSSFNYPAGSGAGTLRFWCAAHDGTVGTPTGGWRWTKVRISGQLQTAKVESTEANPSSTPILHPRNAAMRELFHTSTPITLVESDIIDLPALIDRLQDPPDDPPSSYIRGQCPVYLREWIDLYPGGIWPDDLTNHDADILAPLVAVLNAIILDSVNLYDTGSWSGVTLRQATLWLLDVDPEDGDLLARLNRLLLEDAYPTELLRIPVTSPEPENEIYELGLTETGDDYLVSPTYSYPWIPTGYLPSSNSIKCIYTANAWPQMFRHTILDHWLPQYFTSLATGGSNLGTSMRGVVGDVDPATGNYPYVGFNRLPYAVANRPTAWPVLKQSDFDANGYGWLRSLPGGTADEAKRNRYDPYHNILHSGSDSYYEQNIIAPLTQRNEVFNIEMVRITKQRHEFSCGNRAVAIYISNNDIPDPLDPATYLWTNPKGTFIFPDDLTSAGIDPSIFYGRELYYSYYNPTGTPQTINLRRSLFSSRAGEMPPLPEPYFFPRVGLGVAADGAIVYNASVLTGNDTIGYIYTPHIVDGLSNDRVPAPDRGYSIYEIIIRRPPVVNAAGIRVEDTTNATGWKVEIGFMAGTGVISGAITGTFPGIFITLATAYLFAGTSMVKASTGNHGDLFIPVLEGCPLVWRASVAQGDPEATVPDFVINALVDFAPALNVGFRGRSVVTSEFDVGIVGSYDDAPFLPGRAVSASPGPGIAGSEMNRFLVGPNFYLLGGSFFNLVMPPLSAESLKDLNYFIYSQTPL